MSKTYLSHTWADPRLYVGQSKIAGKGIFTSGPIDVGEIILISGGELVRRDEYERVRERYREQTVFPVDDEYYLAEPITFTGELIDEYLNHSCDSNCWMADEAGVQARRPIAAGEEITVDSCMWNDDPTEEYTETGVCTCASVLCRGVITAEDWKRPELQERYRGHFSPHIEKKIHLVQSHHG